MMRRVLLPGLLALGCLLATHPGAAQGITYLALPADRPPAASQPACVVRVVDARAQRLSIGSVGLVGGRPSLTTFHDGLAATLQAFLRQEQPGRPGARPLVMRVTGLEIARLTNENLAAGSTTAASVVADFYAPQPDSSYRLVAHYAQYTAAPLRYGVVEGFQQALGDLLLLAGSFGIAHAAETAGPSYPAAYVLASELQPAEVLPLFNPEVLPRAGLYYSLPELWSNQPTQPGQPDVEAHPYPHDEWGSELEVKPYYRDKHGLRVPAATAVAFSDGRALYVRLNNNFYQLRRRGPGFVFYGRAGDDPAYRAAARNRYTAATGLLISMALAAPLLERRARYSYSALTGDVVLEPSATESPTSVRPTQLFVYRPRSAKGPAVRIRLAPGQPTQELKAGDYLSFSPASGESLPVALLPGTGPEVHLAVRPTADAPTYLECRPNERIPLRQVADKEGAAALSQLAK